jgi:methionine synthase II (cobalamin-independent)
MRGVCRWLGLALAGGLLLAGCGNSGNNSVKSNSSAASTAATGASTAGTSPASPGAATRVAPRGSKASPEQIATACVRAIEKTSRIAPSAKPHLVQICEQAASPNVATRRKAAREACVELVLAARIPAGPSRERALAICNAP